MLPSSISLYPDFGSSAASDMAAVRRGEARQLGFYRWRPSFSPLGRPAAPRSGTSKSSVGRHRPFWRRPTQIPERFKHFLLARSGHCRALAPIAKGMRDYRRLRGEALHLPSPLLHKGGAGRANRRAFQWTPEDPNLALCRPLPTVLSLDGGARYDQLNLESQCSPPR